MCEEKKNGWDETLAEEAAGIFSLMDPGEYCRFSTLFLGPDGLKRVVNDIRSIQRMMGENPVEHLMPVAAARARLHLLLSVADNVLMPLGRALLNVCSLKKIVGQRRGDGYEMDDAEKSFGAMAAFLSEYLGRAVQGTHRVPAVFGVLEANKIAGILHAVRHYKFSFVNEDVYDEVFEEIRKYREYKIPGLRGILKRWREKIFPEGPNLFPGPSKTWFDYMYQKNDRLEKIDDYHRASFLFEADSKKPMKPNSARMELSELHRRLEDVENDAIAVAVGFVKAKYKMKGVGFDVCMWCGKGEVTYSMEAKRGVCPVCGEMLF